jgi:IS5 family transposase
VLRETDPQTTIWELLLPEEAKRLPTELARVDAYLDDERFITPWRGLFSARLGRPSVPVDTLLRLLYLKHRYGLGYESLCREVADSLSWRRFCRIPLDRPVPHPTTLVKLVRRAGPEVIEQVNAALVAKLAQGKLLRARKLRVDTTVVEADIDYPTDADLLEQAVRKLGGLVRRIKGRGTASRTRFRDRGRAAGRRMKQLARTLRRRTGVAMAEVDRLTGEVARLARQTVREVEVVARNARRTLARRPGDGRLGRLVGELDETIIHTGRLLAQTDQRLAGNRVIADRLVSLADPDARPIRKGKPRHPTQFGYTLLLAEDERGFIADHQLQQGNPPDAPQLVPAVQRVVAVTGRAPGTVVGDRGFGTAANDQAVAALGVKRVGLQRTGTPGTARLALERTRAFPPAAQLAGRHRGPHQPPQARLRAAPDAATPAGRCPHLGRAGHLRLQPAAHDGCRRLTRAPAADLPTSTGAATPTRTSSGASSYPGARLEEEAPMRRHTRRQDTLDPGTGVTTAGLDEPPEEPGCFTTTLRCSRGVGSIPLHGPSGSASRGSLGWRHGPGPMWWRSGSRWPVWCSLVAQTPRSWTALLRRRIPSRVSKAPPPGSPRPGARGSR